ncbi:MAG: universal stress protein [Lautropia sp.]|nr:universal stress protein [Lautropia sp.]
MAKILIPVDGSEPSLNAVNWVIEQIRAGAGHSISLINVQPEIMTGHARAFFKKEEVDAYMDEMAHEHLISAERLLNEAGIPFEPIHRRGHAPTIIAEVAKQGAFDQIVMGTRGLNRIGGLLLGSAATGVLHLVDIPVTLIK